MRPFLTALVVLLSLSLPVVAQKTETYGWDLTYASVLPKNARKQDTNFLKKWLAQTISPAEKWISESNGGSVVSSVLVEFPAFHAGERTTIWVVRTNEGAQYIERVEGKKGDIEKRPIKPEVFDAFLKQTLTWKQHKPKPAKQRVKHEIPGYIGFLNTYDKTGSRQMLLTMDDFMICLRPKKGCMPGKDLISGRLMAALGPILFHEEKSN